MATSLAGGAAYVMWRATPSTPANAAARANHVAATAGAVLHGRSGWAAASKPCGHTLASAWCLMPHPDKIFKGGEDAAFGTENAIGVADGVGGWCVSQQLWQILVGDL